MINKRSRIVVAGVYAALAVCTPLHFSLGAEQKKSEEKNEQAVASLSAEQVKQFTYFVKMRNLRREEFSVLSRIREEKRREVKAFVDEMSKEFEMKPEEAYTYDTQKKALYYLSTNRMDKTGNPERKLVRKIKSDSEAQYISRLMVARKLTEQQVVVLDQLRAEKAKEAKLQDDKLRQTFGLEADAGYRLDEKTGKVFLVPSQVDKPKN